MEAAAHFGTDPWTHTPIDEKVDPRLKLRARAVTRELQQLLRATGVAPGWTVECRLLIRDGRHIAVIAAEPRFAAPAWSVPEFAWHILPVMATAVRQRLPEVVNVVPDVTTQPPVV